MEAANRHIELSLGDIIDKSWTIFTGNFKIIALVTLMVYIPLNAAMAYLSTSVDPLTNPFTMIFASLAIGLVGLVAIIAIVRMTKDIADSVPLGEPMDEIQKAVPLWPRTLLTAIVTGISTMVCFILIIPGIIFSVYWAFAIYAAIIGGKSGFDAMNYSKSLVKGRWWKTLGYFLVLGILQMLIFWIVTYVGAMIVEPVSALSNFVGLAIKVVIDSLINVGLAYMTIISAVMYLGYEATKMQDTSADASEKSEVAA